MTKTTLKKKKKTSTPAKKEAGLKKAKTKTIPKSPADKKTTALKKQSKKTRASQIKTSSKKQSKVKSTKKMTAKKSLTKKPVANNQKNKKTTQKNTAKKTTQTKKNKQTNQKTTQKNTAKKTTQTKKNKQTSQKTTAKETANKAQNLKKKLAVHPKKKSTKKTLPIKKQLVKSNPKTESIKTDKKLSSSPAKEEENPVIKKTLAFLEEELKKLFEKTESQIVRNRQGQIYCMAENCNNPAVIDGYCRLHYFAFYERIMKKKEILEKDLFTKHFLELSKEYSVSILNFLLKDLSSDRSFEISLKKMYLDEDLEDIS